MAGLSFGAFAALLAAVNRPELVRTLVLGEPPVAHLLTTDPSTTHLWEDFMAQAFEPRQKQAHAGDLEGGLRTFLDGAIGPGAFDMLPDPVRQMMKDNASTMGIEYAPVERRESREIRARIA